MTTSTTELTILPMDHLLKLNVIIRLEKVTVGSKNALDFQLTTYLGYLIGTHLKSSNFHIISNDKGFDAVCEYWRREQYFVDRIGNQQTEATNNTNAQNNKKRSLDLQDEIQRYMGNSSTAKTVAKYVQSSKTKSELNVVLSKHFKDGKKVGKILKMIKPVLKKLEIE